MKQPFQIPVVRTAHQHLTIKVEAESLKQARELALEQAGDYEFPGEKEADYSIADAPEKPIVVKIVIRKGSLEKVFSNLPGYKFDFELIDLDTQDADERDGADESLKAAESDPELMSVFE